MGESRVMKRLFDVTEVESLPRDEKHKYIRYMTTEQDIRNQIAFAVAQGEARGRTTGAENERLNTARNLTALGVSVDIIAKATGLSKEEIADL